MSFAVIQTGGKQYKVKAGEILKVEKLIDKDKVEFKEPKLTVRRKVKDKELKQTLKHKGKAKEMITNC